MAFDKLKTKINGHTEKCTEFYDLAECHKIFKKLQVDVTPSLEEINFYGGQRPPTQGYTPETSKSRRELAENRKLKIRSAIELYELMNNFDGGSICFVGPAGSGKTTLMKALARRILRGEYDNLKDVEIVVFLEGRDFNQQQSVSAIELLFNNNGQDLSGDEIKILTDLIKNHPEKFLFVLDSLDTISFTHASNDDVIESPVDASLPQIILIYLLSGDLFPGCRVITSSREYSIRNYSPKIRPNKVVALMGLTKQSILKVMEGYLGIDDAKITMNYLNTQSPAQLALCSTPVVLVYTLIGLKIESNYKPTTMTGIMVLVVLNIMRSPHTRQQNVVNAIEKLMKLSFTGTMEGRVLFTKDEIRNLDLNPTDVSDLVIFAPDIDQQKVGSSKDVLFFPHQSIQELFAAFRIASMNLEEFRNTVEKVINKTHMAVIRRLLCGIVLDNEVHNVSNEMFEGLLEDIDEKRKILYHNFTNLLKSNYDSADLLEILISLYEAKNGMLKITESILQDVELHGLPLTISDVHVVGTVISRCNFLKRLIFHSCNIDFESLRTLFLLLRESKVKMSELWLSRNMNMGIEGLKLVGQICVNHEVDKLGLGLCGLNRLHLDAFQSTLGDKQFQYISLVEKRAASHDDVMAVKNLLRNISGQIYLMDWRMAKDDQLLLEEELKKLQPTKLKIVMDEDHSQVDEIKSEKDLKSTVSITKELNPDGDILEIDDVIIEFPHGAITRKTPVFASVDPSSSNWPENFVGVSPMLTCCVEGFKEFGRPVDVKLPTWVVPDTDNRVVTIMTKSTNKKEKWKELCKGRFGEDGKIQFTTRHFCSIIAVLFWPLSYFMHYKLKIQPFIFRKGGTHFAATFCRKNVTLERRMKEKFENHSEIQPLNHIEASTANTLRLDLECHERNPVFQFIQGDFQTFPVSRVTNDDYKLYFTPDNLDVPQQKLLMKYKITDMESLHELDKYHLVVNWPVDTDEKQPQVIQRQVIIHGDVRAGGDVHIDGNNYEVNNEGRQDGN